MLAVPRRGAILQVVVFIGAPASSYVNFLAHTGWSKILTRRTRLKGWING